MAERRVGPADLDYGTNINNASSGNKDTAIRHIAIDDGLGTILGTATNPLVTSSAAGGSAVTIADGADVAEGAVADAVVAAGAAGTVSAKLRRLTTDIGTLVTSMAATGTSAQNVQGAQARAAAITVNPLLAGARGNSAAPTAVTANQLVDIWAGLSGNIFTTLTSGSGSNIAVVNTLAATIGGSNAALYTGSCGYVYDGTNFVRMVGDTGGTVTQPYALTGSRWQYAAAVGGITNTTTAVTFIAAAGASVRNYVTGIDLSSTALGAATEIAIRDGAGGTVLWRGYIGTAGITGLQGVQFPVPLKGTANTLMEVVTLTASITGAVYFNARGYQGT